MNLSALRELRRAQGVRVANASKHKRPLEVLVYLELEDAVEVAEWRERTKQS